MSIQILTGDCRTTLATLPEKSVQCCITSPPYDNLRTYGGGVSWNFEDTARELYRVMCDGGVICWNVGDSVIGGSETLSAFKQAIFFKDSVGFRVHDTMIYEKSNFGHPEKTRYHQLFEYIFILSKGKPRCFNPIKDKKNIYAGTGALGVATMREADGSLKPRKRNIITEFGMRGNVWKCNTASQEAVCQALPHPAMMPRSLCRDLMLSWSREGDTILDPFFGSGTTGLVAQQHGRSCIGIELNAEYVKLAEKRCGIIPVENFPA